ncbi:hypothetical protein AWZ03_014513 [Drosophila navojoa]|uniref:Uncharacterized protein n=1 Tax=Drosophila navojoa TaxID=7232 RepID=A0A484AU44_DRONA|nr:hypothetical protein AWZ03_014513 [Drosophila navojoa]
MTQRADDNDNNNNNNSSSSSSSSNIDVGHEDNAADIADFDLDFDCNSDCDDDCDCDCDSDSDCNEFVALPLCYKSGRAGAFRRSSLWHAPFCKWRRRRGTSLFYISAT